MEAMAQMGFAPAVAAVALFDFARREAKVHPAALDHLVKIAEAGDVQAQCALYPVLFLSRKSYLGRGPASALVPLLQAGAESGHPACEFTLGVFMDRGQEGFERNASEAESWLTQAALQGSV